jgi:hypothetical protein
MIALIRNVVGIWWSMLHCGRRHYDDDGDKKRQITG